MLWCVEHLDTVDSTQTALKAHISKHQDCPEGYAIHAMEQTSGHGRHGRVWEEGAGNLYLSFLLKPYAGFDEIGHLSLLCSLAASNTIDKAVCNNLSQLKWPNDILINNQKCCGLLLDVLKTHDNKISHLAVGIGVNLKTAPISSTTYLDAHTSTAIDLYDFRETLLNSISKDYERWKKSGFTAIRNEWKAKSFSKGTAISVKLGETLIEGLYEDVDERGCLILRTKHSNELRIISSGDIFLT